MKAIVIVLTIYLVTVQGQEHGHEHMGKFRQHMQTCINETGIEPSILENIKKGDFSEAQEKIGCFATCMLKECGIMNEDGDIDFEAARAKVPPKVPKEEVDRIIAACQSITGSGCEKGMNLLKCFWENKKIPLVTDH